MIKILPVNKIREADAFTIKNEPIPSIELMERAANACFEWLRPFLKKESQVKILCGPGNNGGDGLALARMLAEDDIKTSVYLLIISNKYSHDFKFNLNRLKEYEDVLITEICELNQMDTIDDEDVFVDAIFGSGLSKPIEGFVAQIIEKMNQSDAVCVSIDIPSGLFSDQPSKGNVIVEADYTLSFEFPKEAFLYNENEKYVGDWHVLPIGLHEDYIENVVADKFLMTAKTCMEILSPRMKFSHKGNFGHALLISGSTSRMGASILASKACLRSGVGLLTTHIPFKGNDILQTAVPEAMLSLDRFENYISEVPNLSPYNAIAVGPGIGMEEQSQNALKVLIQNSKRPIIFDADAINILAENKTWLGFLPQNCILTPHPKEFERLVGKTENSFERIQKLKEFTAKYQVIVVLKGAHTVVCTPSEKCFYNSTGNPGMATAGSGDVLTGVILGILAQGYSSIEACVLGVFVHGLAGDLALDKKGHEALIAGDIVEYLGKAFKKLY